MIFLTGCAASPKRLGIDGVRTTQQSLEEFPGGPFDYVWLIKLLASRFVVPVDLRMIWKSDQGSLYRVSNSAR